MKIIPGGRKIAILDTLGRAELEKLAYGQKTVAFGLHEPCVFLHKECCADRHEIGVKKHNGAWDCHACKALGIAPGLFPVCYRAEFSHDIPLNSCQAKGGNGLEGFWARAAIGQTEKPWHRRYLCEFSWICDFPCKLFANQLILGLRPENFVFQILEGEQCAVAVTPVVIANFKERMLQKEFHARFVRAHPFAAHEEGCRNILRLEKAKQSHVAARGGCRQFAEIEGEGKDRLLGSWGNLADNTLLIVGEGRKLCARAKS